MPLDSSLPQLRGVAEVATRRWRPIKQRLCAVLFARTPRVHVNGKRKSRGSGRSLFVVQQEAKPSSVRQRKRCTILHPNILVIYTQAVYV